jgi:hypothetical protein
MRLSKNMDKEAYTLILQFHADNLSSAHVYLRMKSGDSWTSIPQDLLEDCAQLTKANSIEGICPLFSYLMTSSSPFAERKN